VTPDNVEQYYKNVVSDKDAFLKGLPALVAQNLASGDLSNEQLKQS
jgi:ribose transport system substrate-binding protein